ncbi:peptidase C39 family protein [Deinococcus roseus]|uniref:Peptidase C39 n=1 Tax=Deinococcus roseus TaxID=392414 RepID=A0ABQ2CW12_9DEIO|nr:peptidase C39 family protein [Deinococcus roseus]GGJ25981.1 peptidase C39 [Deinococcus roseus]
MKSRSLSLLFLFFLLFMTAHARTTLQTFNAEALQQGSLKQLSAGPTLKLAAGQTTGTLESAEVSVPDFDTLILSWNGRSPVGTQMLLEARVYMDDHWSRYFVLGIWSEDDKVRRSVNGQQDADAKVLTDTLKLSKKGSKYQYRVTLQSNSTGQSNKAGLTPELRNITVMTSAETKPATYPPNKTVWGKVLDVPGRSQAIYPEGVLWCSPASISMMLKYYGVDLSVRDAARKTHDPGYGGSGNWVFNMAVVGGYGLNAHVTRLENLGEVEKWIAKGVPVVISAAWKRGELPHAFLPQSPGHLMVVIGFDRNGNVVVNDPAGKDDTHVRITYDRAILEKLWLQHSGGMAYIIQKP